MRSITRANGRAAVFATSLSVIAANVPIHAQSPPATPPPSNQPAPPEPQLQDKKDRLAEVVADFIARAHGFEKWRQKQAVQADLVISIEGQPTLEGRITYEISRGRARLDLKNGATLIFDGEKAWASPGDSTNTNARFHLRTWSSILAAPFKLRDRGSQPAGYRTLPLQDKMFDAFALHVSAAATGSDPETRMVFAHPRSHLLHAVGGITLSSSASTADKSTHGVIYENVETIDEIKLATKWTFWKWGNTIEGESIGNAVLSNVNFIAPADDAFAKPADAREDAPAQDKE